MTNKDVTLITDIDNTLYDFIDFFGMAFRGMLHVISGQLNVSEEHLLSEFKDVFGKTGTLDYQFLIQNLASARELDKDDLEKVIRYGRIGFDRTKRKRLKPYPGIIHAFKYLERGGVRIIGVTNAPYYHAIRRLQDIGAFQFFSGLVAWEGVPPPENDAHAAERYNKVRNVAFESLKLFEVFSKEFSKPNPFPFLLLKRYLNVDSEIYSLGDSVNKDLAPSRLLNATTIWARYGTVVESKNLQTVLDITPWSEAEINIHTNTEVYEPDHIIDDPEEILRIVPFWKTDLFE